MSITSITRIKGILGMPAGVTFHDASIGYAVDGANKYVLRKIGQASLAVQTMVEWPVVYNSAQSEIQLRHTPVVGIVAITNWGMPLSASDYRVDNELGHIRLRRQSAYWSDSRDGVEVMYGWGYDADTIPNDLKQAADMIAISNFNKGRNSGKKSESEGGYSVTFTDEMIPAEARMILSAYSDAHIP